MSSLSFSVLGRTASLSACECCVLYVVFFIDMNRNSGQKLQRVQIRQIIGM